MERILVVEREPGLGKDLALEGYVVEVAADGVTAFRLARQGGFDLIVMDVMMREQDGMALCREVRRAGVETPILMVQAEAEEAGLVREKELGRTFRLLLEEER